MTVHVDRLPPTQYLILEVLAARYRTGEWCWSFPARVTPSLRALAGLGLVEWTWSTAPGIVRAWLTDAGKDAVLSAAYQPPCAWRNTQ